MKYLFTNKPFVLAALIFVGLSLGGRLYGNDYLFTVIPSIELTDATPKEAIDTIIAGAFEAGANERGFVGVSIEFNGEAKDTVHLLTMSLKDVPLGFALELVAQYFGGQIVDSSKGIVKIGEGGPRQFMIRLSPRVRAAFNLGERPGAHEIREALAVASIRLTPNDEIIVAPEGDLAALRLRENRNGRALEGLIELIEQGLPFRLGSDNDKDDKDDN